MARTAKENTEEQYEYSKRCADGTVRAGNDHYDNVREYGRKLREAKGL